MSKLRDLLDQAINDTLALQDPESKAYRIWLDGPRDHPLPPTVPAVTGRGSYTTTEAALAALATIADTMLKNDPELIRTVSRETARMDALRTFGELLPQFAADPTGDKWSAFRIRLLQRLREGRQTITHYVPVWLFLRQDLAPFSIGPVAFMQREAWLQQIEQRHGQTSPWMADVRSVWSGGVKYDAIKDWAAQAVAGSVHPDQWVAAVTLSGYEQAESYKRALIAVRVALDTLRLLMPSPHNGRISTVADHHPPRGVDRLSQIDGSDLACGWSLNMPGVGGAPGFASALVTEHEVLLLSAGRRIEIAIGPDKSALAQRCGSLSDRWLNAVHWFGRACSSDVKYVSLVMFGIAMDVLSGGLQESGIADLASRLFRLAEDAPILTDGTTLRQLVKRAYSARSQIAHGSVLAIDRNLAQERSQAEELARHMLVIYARELDKYALAGGQDDPEAFRTRALRKSSPDRSWTLCF